MANLIQRTPMVDDDGTGEYGTVVNNDWKQEFYNQIDALVAPFVAADKSTTSVTIMASTPGTYDVVAPAAQIRVVVAAPSSGNLTIRSVTAGVPGDVLIIRHIGVSPHAVLLTHLDGAGTLGKLTNLITSGMTPLGRLGTAVYVCDATYGWALALHHQGHWLEVPYAAGNYTSNVGSWTTVFGQTILRYFLTGNVAHILLGVSGATIAGTPATLTVAGLPFTMQVMTGGGPYRLVGANTGGVWVPAVMTINAATLSATKMDATAFANGVMYLHADVRATVA